jgi:hypothetical protein
MNQSIYLEQKRVFRVVSAYGLLNIHYTRDTHIISRSNIVLLNSRIWFVNAGHTKRKKNFKIFFLYIEKTKKFNRKRVFRVVSPSMAPKYTLYT